MGDANANTEAEAQSFLAGALFFLARLPAGRLSPGVGGQPMLR